MLRLSWIRAFPLGLAGLLMAGCGIQASDSGPIARPDGEYGFRLEKSRMVPMRDGVRLAADIYFPDVEGGKLPTVLIRTPYNKNRLRDEADGDAHMFASHGFVVVAQDSRGKFESEGIFSPPAGKEAEDGYDTVGWIAAQPWSNGKVGMHGCSYPAEVQAATAPLKHPNLTTMIPRNGPMIGAANGRYRYWSGFKGGVLDFAASLPWYFETGVKYSFKPPAGIPEDELARIREFYDPTPSKLAEPDWEKLVWTLPLVDIMNKAGALPNDFLELVTRDFGDPWWHDTMGYYDGTETISVPALHVSSWYDISVDESIFEFNYFRENATTDAAANGQFLILAPSTHCRYEEATARTLVGDRDIGDARLDYYGIYLAWFDYWLKGIDNGVVDGPKVRYYTMGRNEWRSAEVWPLPEVEYTNYYLRSGGNANSRYGDGRLSTEPPGDEPVDSFVYDPANPVPSTGGPRGTDWGTKAGAVDQGRVEVRGDVLVYSTPPLETGIELTGPITAVLYVSSSAKDTDFTVKLVDVYPDGTAYNVQGSVLRARYREGFTRKVWMEPDGVYELRIDLDATSNYFAPGHRIRLQVSSSDFPLYERNLNTGGNNYDEVEWVIAENSVHHSAEHPSHLILPVIPGGD
ncbi:MAG: CocE/NonD family hydrolase [Gammaproteobacteria bacterium]|nr:CocE/NonD family hydrolase [Gammaproteobacteria bacterium]MDE0366554.1 CocE/NonD family hydrolase [Gammaproteobacteria bacterium]